MRRITLWLTSTAAVLVLLFSYSTSTMGAGGSDAPSLATGPDVTSDAGEATAAPSATPTTIPSTAPPRSSRSASPTVTAPAAKPGASASSSASSPASTGTKASVVKGDTVGTRWGPVQVAITVAGNRITAVSVPVYPNGNHRDQEINSYALPVLVKETISAQNAHIDVVSGASVTSNGYIQSLQSALDAAQL